MKISLIKSFYGVARAINQLPPDRYNNYANLCAFLPIAHFFLFTGIPRPHQVQRPQKDAGKSQRNEQMRY